MTLPARIDHLVVLAATLDEGAAWCEAQLGVSPGPGGEHPLMGTHNRLLRIATVDHPRAYFEVIAPQPGREPQHGRRRWFDMDDQAVLAALRRDGPRLAHFVANVPVVSDAVQALRGNGLDRGTAVEASRMTPRGLLQWRITVRDDGRRLFDGCLPTLIEWGDVHPVAALPECGVTLRSLVATHPEARALRTAYGVIGLDAVEVHEGPANLCATLLTPRGLVKLESGGL